MTARFRVSLLLFGLGVFLLDRVVKVYILNNFALGEVRAFLPGFMQLRYTQNTGMAFGLLGDQQWLFIVLVPVLVVLLLVLIAKNIFPCPICHLALVGIIAGGLGNWVDRLTWGFVVDMFEFTFVRFAIFNVADISITLGGILFLVAHLVGEWRGGQSGKKVEGPSDE